MKKLVIFDFDGTIADTKTLYYEAIREKLKKFGLSDKRIEHYIDLGTSMRIFLKKMGFGFLSSFFLEKSIMQKVKKNAEKIKKCQDVDSIKKIKVKKIIVSNSLKDFIKPILKKFKLRFNEIYGAEDFTKKEEFIKKYLKKHKIKKENCYYIGDRVADIKVARKAGCISVIVKTKCAWDSPKELLKNQPDYIISSLKDLNKIL